MEKTYRTSDIYLSAALQVEDLELLGIEVDEKGQGVFVFQDVPERPRLVRDFFNGRLVQSSRKYVDSWLALKKLVVATARKGH